MSTIRLAYIQALTDAIELIGMVDTIPQAQKVLRSSIAAMKTEQTNQNKEN